MMKGFIMEFFFLRFNGYLSKQGYPHHPQPKLATNTIQKSNVAMRYLSSKAIICPL